MTIFDDYEHVIGFECHVQLKTKSKLFSRSLNHYEPKANTLVDVIDVGLPGVLPTINEQAVSFAIKLGLALGCTINKKSVFARKHYFYPDLPKGYQISQFDEPICEHGIIEIMHEGVLKKIRVRRIHIEEDAGKNIHADKANFSYVDFNRAGTPLLEVVTEPDIASAEEAALVFKALRQIVVFLGICDGNMQEGSLRADANVSVRKKGVKELGTRTETKNLNSFKFLKQAVVFETRRQILQLENGEKIVQETRLWDANLKESRAMRSKEDAHDYRYFPDPDLPPLILTDEMINSAKASMVELPLDKMKRYQKEYALSEYDAEILSASKNIADYYEEALKVHHNPKSIANWIINDVLRESKHVESEDADFSSSIPSSSIALIVKMIDNNVISSKSAKLIFAELVKDPSLAVEQIVDKLDLRMSGNDDELVAMIAHVVENHPKEVSDIKAGKDRAFGFLMGMIMKQGKGKIDPKKADALLRKALEN